MHLPLRDAFLRRYREANLEIQQRMSYLFTYNVVAFGVLIFFVWARFSAPVDAYLIAGDLIVLSTPLLSLGLMYRGRPLAASSVVMALLLTLLVHNVLRPLAGFAPLQMESVFGIVAGALMGLFVLTLTGVSSLQIPAYLAGAVVVLLAQFLSHSTYRLDGHVGPRDVALFGTALLMLSIAGFTAMLLGRLTRTLVTEVERSERGKLEYNLLFQQTVLDTVPHPLYFKTVDGVFADCNAAFVEYVGRPKGEILGQRAENILHAEDAPQQQQLVALVVSTARRQSRECLFHHADGSLRDIVIAAAPLVTGPGTVDGIVGVITDISRYKMMETQLMLAKEKADEANRAKGRFLAQMSHDLKTPLNGILGYSNLLLHDPELPETARGRVSAIRSNGDQLSTLVEDILAFSRIEAGKIILNPSAFSLRRFVHDVAENVRLACARKGLEFRYKVASGVPDLLHGDSDRLRQVLYNLLMNGVKFTERGSVTLMIEDAGSFSDHALVRFSVRDTGPGIAPEEQATIFSAFERLRRSNADVPGTGLGLSIARDLLALMQSRIELRSSPGHGSTFFFTVRLGRENGVAEETAPSSAPDTDAVPPDHKSAGHELYAPPAATMARFRLQAQRGNVREMRGELARLRGRLPGYGAFFDRLAELLEAFQIEGVRTFLAQSIAVTEEEDGETRNASTD